MKLTMYKQRFLNLYNILVLLNLIEFCLNIQMNGGIGNVINEIGHVAKDSTDAVKEGIHSVVDVGNGVLRTGEKLGEEVQNVSK